MTEIRLLLTCDYEIFGDGSGSVQHCMIEPANELMAICESADARMTFFADMAHYRAFLESGNPALRQAADTIAIQLRDAVARGHDVQLHMHPQWINARIEDESTFNLDFSWWRLPNAPHGLGDSGDIKSLVGVLQYGKSTLEQLLTPVDSGYRCRAFRAGGLCIQPEKEALKALSELRFAYDSSVAPGLRRNDSLTQIDYSRIAPTAPYRVSSDLECVCPDGHVIERPIITAKFNVFNRLRFRFSRDKSLRSRPHGCCSAAEANRSDLVRPEPLIARLVRAFKSQQRIMELTGVISSNELFFMLAQYRAELARRSTATEVDVVAISHTKCFGNAGEIRLFLQKVRDTAWTTLESLHAPSAWR